MNKNNLHERALEVVTRYKRSEGDLISILQELDKARTYLEHECTSLYSYAVQVLGLSDGTASNFITVARKAQLVPALQVAIDEGALTIPKARKITPVLTLANQEEWVEKAINLSCRKLEEEVARAVPREATPERMKPVSEERVELRMGLSRDMEEKFRRVQDLESQRTGRAVKLEETLEALLLVYLEAKDPVRKAQRILKNDPMKTKTAVRTNTTLEVAAKNLNRVTQSIPAKTRHQVFKRDEGQCVYKTPLGKRCQERRWIDVHHLKPRAEGGLHTLENLITLCSAHHRMEHQAKCSLADKFPRFNELLEN